jgi:L-histidine Nalpha-methyltransferase
MKINHPAPIHKEEPDSAIAQFLNDLYNGLHKKPKSVPCKYLYDERGSILFDKITELDEYYPTRTELHIMQRYRTEIAGCLGGDALLIELGSGSGVKTRVLLDSLDSVAGYVPIDISHEHLLKTVSEINDEYPTLTTTPICADYTDSLTLPDTIADRTPRIVYFPGSTIGNFHPRDAVEFLSKIRTLIGVTGKILIGVDLKKDPGILHRAYNDTLGITALFNLNMLVRANRDLGTDFQIDRFRHYAYFNPAYGRIEMHLVSLDDQSVQCNGSAIRFEKGESIHTENSYKYTVAGFGELARDAGLVVDRVWKDELDMFSVQLLRHG